VIRALLNERKSCSWMNQRSVLIRNPRTKSATLRAASTMMLGQRSFLTTHAMAEADMLCDRISIVDYGKIVALDTPSKSEKSNHRCRYERHRARRSKHYANGLSRYSIVVVHTNGHGRRRNAHKVHASGDESCDNVIDAVRSGAGQIRFHS